MYHLAAGTSFCTTFRSLAPEPKRVIILYHLKQLSITSRRVLDFVPIFEVVSASTIVDNFVPSFGVVLHSTLFLKFVPSFRNSTSQTHMCTTSHNFSEVCTKITLVRNLVPFVVVVHQKLHRAYFGAI